jgi:hypothetical protein
MRRAAASAILAASLLAGAARDARADTADTFAAIGYVASVGAGVIATAVNGSYIAFGEPAARGWRLFGYASGGLDLVWGGVIFAVAGDRSEGIVLGSVATGVGVAAILSAYFVDEDEASPRVVPVAMPAPGGGVTFGVVGRF